MLTGKKKRGRPRKCKDLPSVPLTRQLRASSGEWLSGSAGMDFTPHALRITIGEDISSKVMSFSQHGPRAICILSENGVVSNVTLCQNSPSGGTVTYKGCFEILSLSYMTIDTYSGARRQTGGLCISLSSPDGRVFGGTVGGALIAASPIQVIVGSFTYSEAMAKEETKESIQTGQPGFEFVNHMENHFSTAQSSSLSDGGFMYSAAMAKDKTKEMELEMASLKEKAEEALKTYKVMESELLACREQLSLEKIARQEAEEKNVELKQQLDDAHSVSKEKAEEAFKTWKVMDSELLASREQLSLEKIARQEAEWKNVELKQQLDNAHSVSLGTQNQLRDKEVTLLALSHEMGNIRADLGDAPHQIQEHAEKNSALVKDKAALTVELNNIDIPAACQEFL